MPRPAIVPSTTIGIDAGLARAHRFAFEVERPAQVRVQYAAPATEDFADLVLDRDFTVDADLEGILLDASYAIAAGGRLRISRDSLIERQTGFDREAYARGAAVQVALDNMVSLIEELAAQTGYTGDPARAITAIRFAGGTLFFAHQDGTTTVVPLSGVLSSDFTGADVTALRNILQFFSANGTSLDANRIARTLWGVDATNAVKYTAADAAALGRVVAAVGATGLVRTATQIRTLLFGADTPTRPFSDAEAAVISAIVAAGGVDALLTEAELPEEVARQTGHLLAMMSGAVLDLFAVERTQSFNYQRQDELPFVLPGVATVARGIYGLTVGTYDPVLVDADLLTGPVVFDLTIGGVPSGLTLAVSRPSAAGVALAVSAAATDPTVYAVAWKTLARPAADVGHAERDDVVAFDASAGNETPAVNDEGELVFWDAARSTDRRLTLPRLTVKDQAGMLVGGLDAVKELRLSGEGITPRAVDNEVVSLEVNVSQERLAQLEQFEEVFRLVSDVSDAAKTFSALNTWEVLAALPATVTERDQELVFSIFETVGSPPLTDSERIDLATFRAAAEATTSGTPADEAVVTLTLPGTTDNVYFARIGSNVVYAANDAGPFRVRVQHSRISAARVLDLPAAATTNVDLSVDSQGRLQAVYHGQGLSGGLDAAAVDQRILNAIPLARRVPAYGAGDEGEFLGIRGGVLAFSPASVNRANVYAQAKAIFEAGRGVRLAEDDAASSITVSAGVPGVLTLPVSPHLLDRVRLLQQEVIYRDRQMTYDEAGSSATLVKWDFPDAPANGPSHIAAYSDAYDPAVLRGVWLVTQGTFNMPADLKVAFTRRGDDRQLYDVADTPQSAGRRHFYRLSQGGVNADFSDFDQTETQFQYEGNWESTTLSIPNGYYPALTVPPGDYTFVGGNRGFAGWIETADVPGGDEAILSSWRVEGVRGGSTVLSYTTPSAAGDAMHWGEWADLLTTPALNAMQVGECIVDGHVRGIVREVNDANVGGDRLITEARVLLSRGSDPDREVVDDIVYGPRNLVGDDYDEPSGSPRFRSFNNPSTDFSNASREVDKNLVALTECRAGDVLKLQVRVVSQEPGRIVDFSTTNNWLVVASRGGLRGPAGPMGPQGATAQYASYTTAQWNALSVADKNALSGLVVVT